MSSKPLLFFRDHHTWQQRIRDERRLALQKRDADFYGTFQSTLPK